MKLLLAVSGVLIVAGATAWHGGRLESDELVANAPASAGVEWTSRVADVEAQGALGLLSIATGLGVAGVAWIRRREQLEAERNATSPESAKESGLARESVTTLS